MVLAIHTSGHVLLRSAGVVWLCLLDWDLVEAMGGNEMTTTTAEDTKGLGIQLHQQFYNMESTSNFHFSLLHFATITQYNTTIGGDGLQQGHTSCGETDRG